MRKAGISVPSQRAEEETPCRPGGLQRGRLECPDAHTRAQQRPGAQTCSNSSSVTHQIIAESTRTVHLVPHHVKLCRWICTTHFRAKGICSSTADGERLADPEGSSYPLNEVKCEPVSAIHLSGQG